MSTGVSVSIAMSKILVRLSLRTLFQKVKSWMKIQGLQVTTLLSGKVLLAHVNPLTQAMSFQLQTPIISQLMLGI